jgi:hypothetical protein
MKKPIGFPAAIFISLAVRPAICLGADAEVVSRLNAYLNLPFGPLSHYSFALTPISV